jgi:hypothetical protein
MTNTKTLMIATITALSIGTGAAIAQEADAQFLSPSQIPTPTYQWLPNATGSYVANSAAPLVGVQTTRSETMFGLSHPLTPAPDGSDGGAN